MYKISMSIEVRILIKFDLAMFLFHDYCHVKANIKINKNI